MFSLKKKCNSDIHYDTGEPWRHGATWTKPVTKGQILHDSICMRYLEESVIERERWPVWPEAGGRGHGEVVFSGCRFNTDEEKFSRWTVVLVAQECDRAECHWTAHLKWWNGKFHMVYLLPQLKGKCYEFNAWIPTLPPRNLLKNEVQPRTFEDLVDFLWRLMSQGSMAPGAEDGQVASFAVRERVGLRSWEWIISGKDSFPEGRAGVLSERLSP